MDKDKKWDEINYLRIEVQKILIEKILYFQLAIFGGLITITGYYLNSDLGISGKQWLFWGLVMVIISIDLYFLGLKLSEWHLTNKLEQLKSQSNEKPNPLKKIIDCIGWLEIVFLIIGFTMSALALILSLNV